MKNWCLLRYFKDFFPAKLVKTADLDPEQSYLICSHPHGILCYGAFAAFGTNFLQFDKIFPGIESHIITLKQECNLSVSANILGPLWGKDLI